MWVCEECGSDKVQEQRWVYINTQELDSLVDDTIAYCMDCEQEVSIYDTNAEHGNVGHTVFEHTEVESIPLSEVFERLREAQ